MTQPIRSRQNPLIQQVRRLLSSRKERLSAGLFVSDGTKLLEEALKCDGLLQTVLCTEDVELCLPRQVEKVTVSRDIMAYISPMESPQGALFICKMPPRQPVQARPGMLLLDGIQDPGNLGTILRTADAFDVPVALLEGCADPYSHKVVRASMGAVLRRVPVCCTWQEALLDCQKQGISIATTALSSRAKDIRSACVRDMAVVIGSEGQGVRPQILEEAQEQLIIPMQENCESLNAAVAATVVLWEMRR